MRHDEKVQKQKFLADEREKWHKILVKNAAKRKEEAEKHRQHLENQRREEEKRQAANRAKKLEDDRKRRLRRPKEEAEKEALENQRLQELSKQGPLANAEDLLRTGQITQEEFHQLVSTIEGGKRAELDVNDSGGMRNRAESESTHDPLKAAKKMLDQDPDPCTKSC